MGEINLKKTYTIISKSSVLLVLVLIITIILYFYNFNLEKSVEKTKLSIVTVENTISELSSDERIKTYSFLELNKGYISQLNKISNIPKFIKHMNAIEAKYDITFFDFSMRNGVISTRVKMESDEKLIAYQKASNFIKKYREDKTNLFDLAFVNNIEGMDNIGFSIEFKIK